MTDAMTRAMANTLHDRDVDPLHADAVVTSLIVAGFSARDIEMHYEDVVLMALIRRCNDRRAKTETITRVGSYETGL